MKKSNLKQLAKERLEKIHALSAKLNKPDHNKKLLEMMRSHVDEIEELDAAGDSHSVTEAGDLLILCMEYILENDGDLDAVIELCLGRFKKKLKSLL